MKSVCSACNDNLYRWIYKLLIVDELERTSRFQRQTPGCCSEIFKFSAFPDRTIIVFSNLPFDEWTSVFASERFNFSAQHWIVSPTMFTSSR